MGASGVPAARDGGAINPRAARCGQLQRPAPPALDTHPDALPCNTTFQGFKKIGGFERIVAERAMILKSTVDSSQLKSCSAPRPGHSTPTPMPCPAPPHLSVNCFNFNKNNTVLATVHKSTAWIRGTDPSTLGNLRRRRSTRRARHAWSSSAPHPLHPTPTPMPVPATAM